MAQNERMPNIIYIMSDNYASQVVSAYGGILANILPTPNIDRIANEGAILMNCFATNSISTLSRGAILTGQYSQKNGVYTLADKLDPNHPHVVQVLKTSRLPDGYDRKMAFGYGADRLRLLQCIAKIKTNLSF